MATGQADYQPPGVTHHTARKGNQGEAHCLQTPAHPLFPQHQPLHRRVASTPCWPRRKPAPGQVIDNAVDLLALATLCLDHQIRHHSKPYANPCRTPWQQRATPSAPRSPLPDSYEPVLRVLLAAGFQLGIGSPQPTADPYPPCARPPSGTASATLGTADSTVTSTPTDSITPPRPCPRRSTDTISVSDLNITLSTPAGRCPSASVNTRCW